MHASPGLKRLISEDTNEIIDNPLFHCFVCDVGISSKDEWISHASGRAHSPKNVDTLSARNNTTDICSEVILRSKRLLGDQKKFVEVESVEDQCAFVCVLCDTKVTSYFALGDHLENDMHKAKVSAYQTLKEEKNEIVDTGVGVVSPKKIANNDKCSVPEGRLLTEKLFSNSQNIKSALQELSQFFSCTLQCINCQQVIAVDPIIVTNHLKICFPKEDANERTFDEVKVRDEFEAFARTVESMNRLDGLQMIFNRPVTSQYDKQMQRISPSAFRYLQSEKERLSIMAPLTFKCFNCDLTGSMSKWENHLMKNHLTASNELCVDDVDVIVCTCTLCQVLFLGRREDVVKHEHFVTEPKGLFFLFSSYPQLNSVLNCDHQLPRYYKFLQKLTSSRNTRTVFYCLSCDYYGMDKLRKHFQSKDHKSKTHPMFEFFYCAACSILFYADQPLFQDHCHSLLHVSSKVTAKSNSTCARVDTISKGHEELLSSIKMDVLDYCRLQLLNPVQSFAFWCEPCTFWTNKKNEWQNVHLTSKAHTERMNQEECFEHTCVHCKITLLGSAQFHADHCTSEIHKDIKTKEFRNFNRKRIVKIRSSVRLEVSSAFEKLMTDSTSVIEDEKSIDSVNDENESESSLKHTTTEPQKTSDNDAVTLNETSYDLENDPYSLKLNYSNDVSEKLMKEFLHKIVQKHGAFDRVRSYVCTFCNYYSSEKSWWPHVKTPEHKKALSTFVSDSKSKKNGQLSMIFCSKCRHFGLGNHTMRNIHTSSKNHKKMCTKAKLAKSIGRATSPMSLLSTTDDDDEHLTCRNGISNNVNDCPTNHLNNVAPVSLEETNSSEDEKNEVEKTEDELYDMVMCEGSDAEKIVTSDEELDKSVLKKLKNNSSLNSYTTEELDRDDNEGDNRENLDVEYSLVVSGIPAPVMKNRNSLKETFARYVQFDRTFVKKMKPGSIYLVISKDLEDSFRRLKQNLVHLKAKWGTDELTVDMSTEEKFGLSGMKDHLLESAKLLFSNREELVSAVIHMMNRYNAEANSNNVRRRIHELELVICRLATHIYKSYNVIVKTHVFGSRVTGLAAESSDVDIYLQIGMSFRGLISNNVDLQQQLVVLFSKEMRYHPRDFCDITSIPFARVPIVKFKHIKSNLNCDLSFKSGLSTMNSMLVKTYLDLDERIKFLVCAVKLWMKLNELADRNLFTTYAQIWMVLFFLMQADVAVVPTVIKLKNMLPPEQQILTVEGWNCSFPNIRNIVWRSSCPLSGEELLYKFFVFYSNNTLINYVLCTLTGLKLEKKHFMKYYDSLPEIFGTFKQRIIEDRVLFRKVSNDFESFCVQDPFDHCHNLTKTINVRKFAVFVELCKQTAELLQ